MTDATPNIDRDAFSTGHWCDFCQMWHSARSCWHPGAELANALRTEVEKLRTEVAHENGLFITWRARAEGLEAVLHTIAYYPDPDFPENDLAGELKKAWNIIYALKGMARGALENDDE
jgi:hypothetical protein